MQGTSQGVHSGRFGLSIRAWGRTHWGRVGVRQIEGDWEGNVYTKSTDGVTLKVKSVS